MKYIDADKLIKSVNNYQEGAKAALNPIDGDADYYNGKIDACENIQEFITSLQQEQPEPSCKSCGFYENNCPFIRGKFIPYPKKVCKDYTYSVMKEQLDVDLEKEIAEHAENMPHGEFTHESECIEHEEWAEREFRHFYKLGLYAKHSKGANVEEEVKSYIKDNFTITDEVAQIPEEDRRYSMWEDDMVAFAKHFFKLGLNARKEE